jgi:hypothetical protein
MSDPKRYIGTFHKTGSALFGGILRKCKRKKFLEPWLMNTATKPAKWDIAFHNHANKLLDGFDTNAETSRYVFSIRDPRDVVISSAYYHCKADEHWLLQPNPKFDGMTYQQKINSLPDMQARFQFEIDHVGGTQIRRMLTMPFGSPSLLITRLETLVVDEDLVEFDKIYTHLAFSDAQIATLKKFSFDNSLFSRKTGSTVHARSGKAAQYKSEFSQATMDKFVSVFSDAAAKLGYEA